MTNVTFSLPDRTIQRLRKRVAAGGGRKGVISQIVDRALNNYLDRLNAEDRREVFSALRGEEVVAQARSLEELARALREKRVDWRTVLITSSDPLDRVGHLGLRVRNA